MSYYNYPPYVPVAVRREKAQDAMDKLAKKGEYIHPIRIKGLKITKSFWGTAWCTHIESYSDCDNRLPRGRSYVRNGSVCHLEITAGAVKAVVSGSSLYKVSIAIKTLPKRLWENLKTRCSGGIHSIMDLLQGELSDTVMRTVTDSATGIFPQRSEITLRCNCPDSAIMCKHVAATLYGVGARLDEDPSLLFTLRGVNHEELIQANARDLTRIGAQSTATRLDTGNLGDIFGVEMAAPVVRTAKKAQKAKKSSRKTAAQKRTAKVTAKKPAATAQPYAPTGANVLAIRTAVGLNKSAFARLLNVSVSSVTRWEKTGGSIRMNAATQSLLAGMHNDND